MEAYWSFHAQQNGIFLSGAQKEAYLGFLERGVRRLEVEVGGGGCWGRGEKEEEGRERREEERERGEDVERWMEVLGRTPEERFRVYCSWGKGKKWLEGVVERKRRERETERERVVGGKVTESELNATRVKFFAAREEVRREKEEKMMKMEEEESSSSSSSSVSTKLARAESATNALGGNGCDGGVGAGTKEMLSARFFAAREEARRIQEEVEKELEWDGSGSGERSLVELALERRNRWRGGGGGGSVSSRLGSGS